MEYSHISDCRAVAHNWEHSTIEFGQYSVRVSKQELFHTIDGDTKRERIMALKAEIVSHTEPHKKGRRLVRGGVVNIPGTLGFNIGTGLHVFTLDTTSRAHTTPVFKLDYSISAARQSNEEVDIKGMMTTEVYRGIGIGSAVIEKFLESFSNRTPIALIAVSEAAKRFWESGGFTVQGSGLSDMPNMSRDGTNTTPYTNTAPDPPLLNGLFTLAYDEGRQIRLQLEDSFHYGGNSCHLCTLAKEECMELSCTHYTGENHNVLEFQQSTDKTDKTEELEFNLQDLKLWKPFKQTI
jgi:GNAT superfamily N-acetyltransferase